MGVRARARVRACTGNSQKQSQSFVLFLKRSWGRPAHQRLAVKSMNFCSHANLRSFTREADPCSELEKVRLNIFHHSFHRYSNRNQGTQETRRSYSPSSISVFADTSWTMKSTLNTFQCIPPATHWRTKKPFGFMSAFILTLVSDSLQELWRMKPHTLLIYSLLPLIQLKRKDLKIL